ncbi:uncharacterized protein LTR77_007850 [Saxophila tyrrhenica]|uniref:Uncharacterized protein n=1 Tax=Saxophila tyrrhenica TaxID=1690608 RepID=A0AAV9P726_9PEZI|nr:hypothetical protein LTR77_007850 [Saxophila tyrrhenica]
MEAPEIVELCNACSEQWTMSVWTAKQALDITKESVATAVRLTNTGISIAQRQVSQVEDPGKETAPVAPPPTPGAAIIAPLPRLSTTSHQLQQLLDLRSPVGQRYPPLAANAPRPPETAKASPANSEADSSGWPEQRALSEGPAAPREQLVRLHSGQYVPEDWTLEWEDQRSQPRYLAGLCYRDNQMLKAPLLWETLEAYKQRQKGVVGRESEAAIDEKMGAEYLSWARHGSVKVEWIPKEDSTWVLRQPGYQLPRDC